MINVFLTLELTDSPIYVARNLGNLPPLSAFDNDVLSLHRDVEQLKASMLLVHECRKDIADLAKGIKKLHSQPTLTEEASNRSKTVLQNDQSRDNTTRNSINSGTTTNTAKAGTEIPKHREQSEHSVSPFHPALSDIDMNDLEVVDSISDSDVSISSEKTSSNSKENRKSPPWQLRSNRKNMRKTISPSPVPARKKDSVLIGRGTCYNLQSVQPKRQSVPNYPNRTITGVFLSRLGPKTTAAQLAVHIRREKGLTVRPERLRTKYSEYSSFYICVDKYHRSTIMDIDLWPKGTLVKPFYN